MMKPEQKSIIEDIANKVVKIFNVDRFRTIVHGFLSEEYLIGSKEVEDKFGFNVHINDQGRDMSMLEQYTFDNIKGMTDEMEGKLRQELQRGLMANESPPELRKRISDIFKGDNPTRFNYEDRLKVIVRTESKRAQNMAKINNVKRLNRPDMYKYLLVREDARTSGICNKENSKYGSPEKAIPIDDDFVVTVNGKTYKEPYPPFHPNCRTSVTIIRKGEQNDS